MVDGDDDDVGSPVLPADPPAVGFGLGLDDEGPGYDGAGAGAGVPLGDPPAVDDGEDVGSEFRFVDFINTCLESTRCLQTQLMMVAALEEWSVPMKYELVAGSAGVPLSVSWAPVSSADLDKVPEKIVTGAKSLFEKVPQLNMEDYMMDDALDEPGSWVDFWQARPATDTSYAMALMAILTPIKDAKIVLGLFGDTRLEDVYDCRSMIASARLGESSLRRGSPFWSALCEHKIQIAQLDSESEIAGVVLRVFLGQFV
jgi:hypothetical protein